MTHGLGEPRLRLRGPIDVLAAVPYLIGYHPTDSIVVLAMRGRRLFFTVRDDLPDAEDLDDAVSSVLDMVGRRSVTGVLLVAYGPEERARPVLFGLRDECDAAGFAVLELLRAHEGRYWSYLCTDPDCCPTEGAPYDVHNSAVPAEATAAGCVVLPDRETYESLIRPEDGPGQVWMGRATARAGDRLLALVASGGQPAVLAAGRLAVGEAIERQAGGDRLDDEQTAWLTVLLTSIPVRDGALSEITGPPGVVTMHRTLWMDVFRRAAPDFIAAPGSLFGFAAWRCGEATLARLALERVLGAKPDYDLAVLMHRVVASGLPPSALEEFGIEQIRRRYGRRRRRRSSSRRAGNRRA